jgi:hypothetical protein
LHRSNGFVGRHTEILAWSWPVVASYAAAPTVSHVYLPYRLSLAVDHLY